MDELFRKAAKDYNLVLPEDDWDHVAAKIVKPALVAVPKENRETKKRFAFLLLAFSVIFTFALLMLYPSNNIEKLSIVSKLNQPHLSETEKNKNDSKTERKYDNSGDGIKDNKTITGAGLLPKLRSLKNRIPVLFNSHKTKKIGTAISDFEGEGEPEMAGNKKNDKEAEVISIHLDAMKVVAQGKMIIPEQLNIGKFPTDIPVPVKSKKKSNNKPYLEMLVGPECNQIKNQGFSTAGLCGGIVVGMFLNKNLSLETGALVSQKKYYSKGTYFSMTELASSMPAGMELLSLQGKTTVVEIPINLKYNLIKKNKSIFFGTAGLSSYLLTNENNQYLAMVNGNEEKLTGNYSKYQKYFMASLNFGVGYEYKITKKISLRLDPYLQIPIKGMGIGSMPVTSAGIHLGISSPF